MSTSRSVLALQQKAARFVYASLIGIVVVAHTAVVVANDDVHGELLSAEECSERLREIAVQTKENFERLTTWSAEWDGVLETFDDNQGSLFVERFSSVSLFDRQADRVLWEIDGPSQVEVTQTADGARRTQATIAHRYTAVLTAEHLLYCDAGPPIERVGGFDLILWAKDVPKSRAILRSDRGRFSTLDAWRISDPRRFWQIGTFFPWVFAEGAIGEMALRPVKDSDPRFTAEMRRIPRENGDELRLTLQRLLPGDPISPQGSTLEVAFDSKVGFAPTIWRQSVNGKGVDREQRLGWGQHAGVFVPERYEDALYGVRRAGSEHPVARLKVRATATNVNTPIAPDVFDIERFDLKYGDRIYDMIERKVAVFNGENCVPVDEFEFDPNRVDSSQRSGVDLEERSRVFPATAVASDDKSSILLWLHMAAIGVGAAVFWRRWRRGRQSS